MFVAGRVELEEQVRGVLFEGEVCDFVDDGQSVSAQFGQFDGERVAAGGVLEAANPVGRGREKQPLSRYHRATSTGDLASGPE